MQYIHNNITLSFSGKRQHEHLEKLSPVLWQLFQAFQSAFRHTHFHLLCGLADGADQVATQTLIGHLPELTGSQQENKWTIGAVMAFRYKDYLETIRDKDLFLSLYNHEAVHQKLHLDGIYEPGEQGSTKRSKAHRQQGKALARFGDLVIAAASRKETGKEGGTIENIIAALHRKKPVVFFDLDTGQLYLYKEMQEWVLSAKEPQQPEDIIRDLHEMMIGSNYQKSGFDGDLQQGLPDPGLPKYRLSGVRATVWNIYEVLFHKKKLNNKKKNIPEIQLADTTQDHQSATGQELKSVIKRERSIISNIAGYFQTQYRGGYMFNYFSSACAIFIAITAFLYYIFMSKYFPFNMGEIESASAWSLVFSPAKFPWQYLVLIVLGLAKVFIIRLIINNTHEANEHDYNKQAIHYRYASERLKFNEHLSFAGVFSPPKPTLGKHSRSFLQNNPGEFYYEQRISKIRAAVAYKLELTSGQIINHLNELKESWYSGQQQYHENKTKEFDHTHERIEQATLVLSKAVVWIIIIEMVVKALEGFILFPDHVKSFLGILGPVLLALAILLPAIVVILISINFHTENKKIADRHKGIVEEIKGLQEMLDTKMVLLRKNAVEGSIFIDALEHLDEMGTLMIDDVAEWAIFYKNKVYEV